MPVNDCCSFEAVVELEHVTEEESTVEFGIDAMVMEVA